MINISNYVKQLFAVFQCLIIENDWIVTRQENEDREICTELLKIDPNLSSFQAHDLVMINTCMASRGGNNFRKRKQFS